MQYRWDEIDQLATILEAEASGCAVDTARARDLAHRLMEVCPDIAGTMRRVIERYAQQTAAVAA